MNAETIAILNLIDAMPNFTREQFLADIEPLFNSRKFFTAEELAVRYGVSEQTIRNWARDKKLEPSFKMGIGCLRYSAADIAEFEKKYNPDRG